MVFSSYLFLFFFLPAALACYYASPRKWKHLVLTLFSYLFYGWANPYFCMLMLFNTTVDYTNGRLIERFVKVVTSGEWRGYKRKLLSLFMVSAAMLLGFPCKGYAKENSAEGTVVQMSAISDGPRGAERIVFRTSFQEIFPLNANFISSFARKKNIDLSPVPAMVSERNWDIDWSTITEKFFLGEQDKHWSISSGSTVSLRSFLISSHFSRKLSISLCVQGGTALAENSYLAVSIIREGFCSSGEELLKEIEVHPKEKVNLELPFSFAEATSSFRVKLQIRGHIILQEMIIRDLPDDLFSDGITLVEGTIEECSVIPDPKKSDYPDLRYTMSFAGASIQDGAPCPQRIQLIADGFSDYKLLPAATLKAGDKICCYIIPFEKLPEKKKMVQQADDLELITLESYYLLDARVIGKFRKNSFIDFTLEDTCYVSVFERNINPPLPEAWRLMQAQSIAAELKKINHRIDDWTEDRRKKTEEAFEIAWKKEKDAPGFNRVGNDVWRNVDNSFWCLPENFHLIRYNNTPIAPENMEALISFRDFLNANGCQLAVSVVPDFYDIAARVILPEFRSVPDFYTEMLVRQLLQNDIEAVSVSEELLQKYNLSSHAFFFPKNPHPADTTQILLAEKLANLLARYEFVPTLNADAFSHINVPHVYSPGKAYAYPENCDIGENKAGENFLCCQVLYNNKKLDFSSPSSILLLGNSFMQTPLDYPDSLPSYLTEKCRYPVLFHRVNAVGPLTNIIQQIFKNPGEYLKNRKIVILVLGRIHLGARVRFSNIRKMDETKKLLNNKSFLKKILVQGNTENIPSAFANLSNIHCFTIPAEKNVIVSEFEFPVDKSAESCLVIPVIAFSPCTSKIVVNGIEYSPEECVVGAAEWSQIVVPISRDSNKVKIELTGNAQTVIAVGDIQIYQ